MRVEIDAKGGYRRALTTRTHARWWVLAATCAVALIGPATAIATPTPPSQDPFYSYEGSRPLKRIAPGTVLKTRTTSYNVVGIPLPVTAVQLLYRTTNQLGKPAVNVTSVLLPPAPAATPTVVSYQSFYDSLTNEDDPSYAISGGVSFGGLIPDFEAGLIAAPLLQGDTVVVPDTEGENADFAAGPEYGLNTIDSLRAALSSPATGLAGTQKVGLIGYSGGAIATEWAAELAPSYAPELNSKIVGVAFGGTLVDPAHNLRYVEGSSVWAGVIPMGLIGIARAFDVNLTRYMTPYGQELNTKLQHASITEVLGQYPGLTWAQIAKPQYPTPESVPVYVKVANQLIMGTRGTPTEPLLIGQGNGGELEGTSGDKPGIGPGDGVMIAGDVRSLAREYCSRGVTLEFKEYEHLGHIAGAGAWASEAYTWLDERFDGTAAPQNCSSIAAGNSIEPLPK